MDELLYWSGRRMLLDEYLQGDLTPNRLPPTWVSRTKFVFQSDDGGLAVMDTANDSVNILVTNHTLVNGLTDKLIIPSLTVQRISLLTHSIVITFSQNPVWITRHKELN